MSFDLVSLNKQNLCLDSGKKPFCNKVRGKYNLIDLRCIYCDYNHIEKRTTEPYPCHLGLWDMVAPVTAGDQIIAGLFIDQLPGKKMENILDQFVKENRGKSNPSFRGLYERCLEANKNIKTELDKYQELLLDMAGFLSSYASTSPATTSFQNYASAFMFRPVNTR